SFMASSAPFFINSPWRAHGPDIGAISATFTSAGLDWPKAEGWPVTMDMASPATPADSNCLRVNTVVPPDIVDCSLTCRDRPFGHVHPKGAHSARRRARHARFRSHSLDHSFRALPLRAAPPATPSGSAL